MAIDEDAVKRRKTIRLDNPSDEARRRELEEDFDSCRRAIDYHTQMHQSGTANDPAYHIDQWKANEEKLRRVSWELNQLVAPYYIDR